SHSTAPEPGRAGSHRHPAGRGLGPAARGRSERRHPGLQAQERDGEAADPLHAGGRREAEEPDRLHHLHDQRGAVQRRRRRAPQPAHQGAHAASRPLGPRLHPLQRADHHLGQRVLGGAHPPQRHPGGLPPG
ncbi:hypothetical protein CRUP_011225, partial [Coryphaenoides rupestris]